MFLGIMKNWEKYVNPYIRDYKKKKKKKKNHPPWTDHHTEIVKKIKKHVKTLLCLGLPSPTSFKIVETDAYELGYGSKYSQTMYPKT